MATRTEMDAIYTSIEQDIIDAQETHKQQNGKYLQMHSFNGSEDVKVHEYQSPDGVGYIIYLIAQEGDDTYKRAIDKGAEGRSFDWVQEVI